MLKQTLNKFHELERVISEEKGPFDLFALFLRHDSLLVWDLIVSASWLTVDEKAGLGYLAKKLQESLTPEELVTISRIVILGEDSPILRSVQSAIAVEHGMFNMVDCLVDGISIKHAYIITSTRKTRVA